MTDEGQALFWQKALLRNFADDCVYHVVLPTIMSTQNTTWIKLKQTVDPSDPELVQAQRYNLFCGCCNSYIAGKYTKVGVRVVIGKRAAPKWPDNTPSFVYRASIGCAAICEECCVKRELTAHLDANNDMTEEMCQRLEAAGREVGYANMETDVSGDEYLMQMLRMFYADYGRFMSIIGGMDTQCATCNNKTPGKRCSICHYVHYCNAKCSAADWPKHKLECRVLSQKKLFYFDKLIRVECALAVPK